MYLYSEKAIQQHKDQKLYKKLMQIASHSSFPPTEQFPNSSQDLLKQKLYEIMIQQKFDRLSHLGEVKELKDRIAILESKLDHKEEILQKVLVENQVLQKATEQKLMLDKITWLSSRLEYLESLIEKLVLKQKNLLEQKQLMNLELDQLRHDRRVLIGQLCSSKPILQTQLEILEQQTLQLEQVL